MNCTTDGALGEKPRCLLGGRSRLLLEGLSRLLDERFEVRLAPVDGEAAIAAAADFDPKVAVIDVDLGGTELETARLLIELRSSLTVICLLPDSVAPLPELRWISKAECTTTEFVHAVHAACTMAGPPAPHRSEDRARADRVQMPVPILSQRERQVLTLLVRGLTMKEVGRILGITARTVAFHKYRIMENNNLRKNSELIGFAISRGISRN